MKISIIDTNVLVRFFLGDNKQQRDQAVKWFREVTGGKRRIIVKTAVVAEVVYVLESVYEHTREEVAAAMFPFLAMPVLDVEERPVLVDLWGDYVSGLHFVDAYLLTCSRHLDSDLLTFDKKLAARSKF